MKRIILSLLILVVSSPIVAMQKEKDRVKSREAKSNDVTQVKADKESKKQSLLACFKCESKAENK